MYTIQQILNEHLDGLLASRELSAPQSRAARALSVCRTAALGGHVQRCPNGHVERVWYNSCRHRACPQCNGLAKEQWLERTRARLIDCPHWHVVFTIPHELNVLWMLNTDALMSALFAASRATLLELLRDVRHLGAQPGIMLALHTWGRSLNLHPHIHALVTDGGLRDGIWHSPRRSHFLPATVLMRLFRGKLLDALRTLHQAGELRLPDDMSPERFASLTNRLGRRVKWNVRVCARYEHGRGVSIYLARYVKGGPFNNTQIVHARHDRVIFRYSAHAQGDQPRSSATLVLRPERFLARVLAHAPEPNRQSVRYCGLYANACSQPLNAARALHQQIPVQPRPAIAWQGYLARFPRLAPAAHCARCHAPLVRGALIAASRAPP